MLGCGGQPPRGAIEGNVFLGTTQPLHKGIIRFLPLDHEGATVFTEIKDGKYKLVETEGPTVGKHRVQVTALRKCAEKIPVPDGPPGQFQEVEEQYISAAYNVASTIVVEIKQGTNQQDFTVQGID